MAVSKYRYTFRSGDVWGWKAHGKRSTGFKSEALAVKNLAAILKVPVNALAKKGATKVSKTSKFEGVFWHSARLGWLSKTKTSQSKLFLTDELCARDSKAKKRNLDEVNVDTNGHQPRRYKYVCWHSAKKCWMYKVKIRARLKQGFGFSTQVEAAEGAARALGVTVASLQKAARRKPTAKTVIAVLKVLLRIYSNGSSAWKRPADLTGAIQLRKEHPQLPGSVRVLLHQVSLIGAEMCTER
jgi:hypothetical protein